MLPRGRRQTSDVFECRAFATLLSDFDPRFVALFLNLGGVFLRVQYMWESAQTNSYIIKEDSTEPIEGSGTRIVLHLKEDSEEYLDDFKVRSWFLQRFFAGRPFFCHVHCICVTVVLVGCVFLST